MHPLRTFEVVTEDDDIEEVVKTPPRFPSSPLWSALMRGEKVFLLHAEAKEMTYWYRKCKRVGMRLQTRRIKRNGKSGLMVWAVDGYVEATPDGDDA
jgi:hypothetical protein